MVAVVEKIHVADTEFVVIGKQVHAVVFRAVPYRLVVLAILPVAAADDG